MTNPTPRSLPALGICLEEYEYPYPVQFLSIASDLQPLKMACMDIRPDKEPNGRTVVLFHGKAFGGYYFLNVIEALTATGYRVVAPDQVGWGRPRTTPQRRCRGRSELSSKRLDYKGFC